MKNYLDNVCKIGQGASCCKYLVAGSKGFECMRVDPKNKEIIDENWKIVKHVSQGDNCMGQEDLHLAKTYNECILGEKNNGKDGFSALVKVKGMEDPIDVIFSKLYLHDRFKELETGDVFNMVTVEKEGSTRAILIL